MKNALLKLAKKLIEVESVSGNNANLQKVLNVAKAAIGSSYQIRSFESNKIPSLLIFNTKKFPNKFKVILNAHLDVVPGREKQYHPKVVGVKLFGRGAHDMKGSAAAEILAFKNVAYKVKYPLALQLVTDEEIGGFDGTKYQLTKGVRSDFVIAGETTNFAINHEAKGILWIKATAKGKSAHGARPWDGENAIQKMVKFVNQMNKSFPTPARAAWKTTQNLAKIESSNQTFNKVPDNCSASFDIRYVPSEKNKVIETIKKAAKVGVEIEFVFKEPSQFTKTDNPFITKLSKSIKKYTGKNAKFVSFHGASDVRHYSSLKMDGICFGPIGSGLHTDNEWSNIKSLIDYQKMLESFLLDLNG